MTRKEFIKHDLQQMGFAVAEHSPGDGVTRYKVGAPGQPNHYFGMSDFHSQGALGLRELEMLHAGLRLATQQHRKSKKAIAQSLANDRDYEAIDSISAELAALPAPIDPETVIETAIESADDD